MADIRPSGHTDLRETTKSVMDRLLFLNAKTFGRGGGMVGKGVGWSGQGGLVSVWMGGLGW